MGRRKSHGKGRGRKEKKVVPQFVGKVQMTREGFAFIIVDGEEDDIFVKASKTRGALNGDLVRVAVTREQTAIFCGMKLLTNCITASFIRQPCPSRIGCAASTI